MLNQYTVYYHEREAGRLGLKRHGTTIISGTNQKAALYTFRKRFKNRVIEKIKLR